MSYLKLANTLLPITCMLQHTTGQLPERLLQLSLAYNKAKQEFDCVEIFAVVKNLDN